MAQEEIHLDAKRIGGITIVSVLTSKVAYEQLDEFAEQLRAAIAEKGDDRVVIDFEVVDHISSTFLGKLIALQMELGAEGGKLRLCGLSKRIHKIFKITKLDRAFEIRKDVEAAMDNFV